MCLLYGIVLVETRSIILKGKKAMNHTVHALAALVGCVSVGYGSIAISPTMDPDGYATQLTLMGSEGVPVGNARWFDHLDNGEAVTTYWANQKIVYSADLAEGDWRVGLTARNYGELPEFYTEFRVDVFVNNSYQSTVLLPAIQDEYRTTWFDIGQQDGMTDLKLVWKNDYWVPNVYDANIVFGAVQFASTAVPAAPTAGVFALAGLALERRRR